MLPQAGLVLVFVCWLGDPTATDWFGADAQAGADVVTCPFFDAHGPE